MEKRVFLAIFLCFGILAIYQAYFAPKETPEQQAAAGAPAAPGAASSGASATTAAAPVPGALPPAPKAPAAQTLVADTAAHDIDVDTDTVHAVFSTAGATLKSWKLKKYTVEELGADGKTLSRPLDLVPQDLPETLPRPFTMLTDNQQVSATLASALYQPSSTSLTLGSTPGTLTFEYRDASGLNARKTFHFQPEGKQYVLDVDATVDVGGAAQAVELSWGPALGLGWKPDGSRDVPVKAVMGHDGKIDRIAASKLQTTPQYQGPMRYAGVEEQYFLSVALPPGAQAVQVDYAPITLPVPNDPGKHSRNFIAYTVRTPGAASLAYFMGPKDLDQLKAVDPELVLAIDFGMFSWLVVPLLQALKWINHYVGNYGWSIIVLTLLINVIIFPLRHRSMVQMKKMQTLKPQVDAINERYKKYKLTDPERQKANQEVMALYKQHGANPASGCVPMLLTFPILFAFYGLLGAAIELRGAPFVGWIHDLSLHDPYYITPVIMGLTMFLQQRMMPSTADPMQQKMFMILPIVFTFTFLWVPSGLVVYWLASNVLAIGQQWFTNRVTGGPAPARVPARPAPKPVGNGRTSKT